MQYERVTVFGGSGFIGRHLVRRLAAAGATVRVAVRDPERALFLKPMGDVGQIVPMRADLRDEVAIAEAVRGADAVVNLVGILYEKGRQRFEEIHHRGSERVARAVSAEGVTRLVQVSAIGASERSASGYAQSKAAAETAVRNTVSNATIARPSIVFGPEDEFFNRFAALARLLPVLPVYCAELPKVEFNSENGLQVDLFGAGGTRFQPVYVGDVADAVMKMLSDEATAGRTYELGGPRVYSFKELMELLLAEIRRKRLLIPLPFIVADIQAAILQLLPRPPLTRDQVKMLRHDNIVTDGALNLADLGIQPTALEAVLPTYMDRFRVKGRFSEASAA